MLGMEDRCSVVGCKTQWADDWLTTFTEEGLHVMLPFCLKHAKETRDGQDLQGQARVSKGTHSEGRPPKRTRRTHKPAAKRNGGIARGER